VNPGSLVDGGLLCQTEGKTWVTPLWGGGHYDLMATTRSEKNPDWIPVGEAFRRLAVSRDTVLQLIRDGRLTSRKVPGGWLRVRADEVDALIAECTKPATKPAAVQREFARRPKKRPTASTRKAGAR
jgi:excisionase family DNA binding protein